MSCPLPHIPLFKTNIPKGASRTLAAVLDSGYIAQGGQVLAFEERLGHFLGNPLTAAFSDLSGTLTLCLRLAGVGPGDEVIVSPLACTATTMPIVNLFATPVWCDVDPDTGMPAPEHIRAQMTPKTRAVILYHWSGYVGDIKGISALGLPVIEDASEAFGAACHDAPLGNSGTFAAIYSFGAVRHITTAEGAAALFCERQIYEKAKRLRKYGIDTATFRTPDGEINPHSDIPDAGYFFPMNNLEAALGLSALDNAPAILARYASNGIFYETALSSVPGIGLHPKHPDTRPAYWTFSLLAERRDDLARKLKSHGIGCQLLHIRNDQYGCFGAKTNPLPGVAHWQSRSISIPCGWWVGDEDRQFIAARIKEGW